MSSIYFEQTGARRDRTRSAANRHRTLERRAIRVAKYGTDGRRMR